MSALSSETFEENGLITANVKYFVEVDCRAHNILSPKRNFPLQIL